MRIRRFRNPKHEYSLEQAFKIAVIDLIVDGTYPSFNEIKRHMGLDPSVSPDEVRWREEVCNDLGYKLDVEAPSA